MDLDSIRFYKECDERNTEDVVDIPAVLAFLENRDYCEYWDEADETLGLLDKSYADDLPQLTQTLSTARDADGWRNSAAQSYALSAILSIDPHLHCVAAEVAQALQTEDQYVRHKIIMALRHCEPQDYQVVIPVLVAAAKDWRAYVSTMVEAFVTIVKMIGFRRAMRALW